MPEGKQQTQLIPDTPLKVTFSEEPTVQVSRRRACTGRCPTSGSSPSKTLRHRHAALPVYTTPAPTWNSDLNDVQLVRLDFDLPDPTQLS